MTSEFKNKGLSKANLFYVFVGISLVIAIVASYFLIGERIKQSTINFQDRSTQSQADSASRVINTYLSDRVQLLKDLSTQPILANTVMGTLTSRDNLIDFMDTYRIFGKIESLYLLDILGNPIYQTTEEKLIEVLEEEPWFLQLIDGDHSEVIQVLQKGNNSHFSIAVPVKYNDASEGVILVRFKDNIKDLVTSIKIDNAISIKGEYVDYSSQKNMSGYREINSFNILDNDLLVTYYTDSSQLILEVNSVVERAYIGIIGSLLLAFIFLFFIGKKFFVDPFKAIEKSESELRKQQSINRELLEALSASPVGVTVVDAKQKDMPLIYANKAFLDITRYSLDEVLGQNHRFLTGVKTSKETSNFISQSLKEFKPIHIEILNYTKDGKPFWNDLSISPVFDKNNQLTAFVGIQNDVTEKIQRQKELEDSQEAAQSANKAKSEFLANMSHEIRTPMNGVIGMTNLLLETNLNEEQREFTEIVSNSANGLLTIINDILDFSKVEAGKLELEPIKFNLGTLLDDFGTEISHRIQDKDIELICPATPVLDQWYIADPGRIRQILTNLVGNAIKFTSEGEIAVFYEILNDNKTESLIKISVKDTGIGLTKDQIDRLFDRFSQADGSTTRQYGGTGLGLSISKQLVELMNGEIGVDSKPGEGSTFWFTLKIPSTDEVHQYNYSADPKNEKILIVDDNQTNLRLLDLLMERWGIRHALADNATAALEQLRKAISEEDPFTLIISDHQMPDIDGFQLAKMLHAEENFKDLKIILLSSSVDKGDAKLSQEAGFSAYLTKPIDQIKLYNIIMKVAGLKYGTGNIETRYTVSDLQQFSSHILLVEDNSTNQIIAKRMLEKYGLTIEIAENGEQAIEKLSSKNFDLIFMDCQMPVMDGFEATKFIRASLDSKLNTDITIVAMTANAIQGDREACIEAGMNDYLTKPINPNDLQNMLLKWLVNDSLINQSNQNTIEGSNISKDFDFSSFSKRMMDDQDLMMEVAKSYVTDMEITIPEMLKALKQNQNETIIKLAHKIKGVSLNIGAVSISTLAKEIESLEFNGNENNTDSYQKHLLIEFDNIKHALNVHNLL